MMVNTHAGWLVCAAVMLVILAAQESPIYAQKSGPAAKGGSLAVGRDVDAGIKKARDESPGTYRQVVLELGLDYNNVLAEYSNLKSAAHPPSFKDVILANIAARGVSSSSRESLLRDILNSLGDLGSLERALASTLKPYTIGDAKWLARAAEREFKQAAARVRAAGAH